MLEMQPLVFAQSASRDGLVKAIACRPEGQSISG
jgi:hypothetical protein